MASNLFLPRPPKCWDYGHGPRCQASGEVFLVTYLRVIVCLEPGLSLSLPCFHSWRESPCHMFPRLSCQCAGACLRGSTKMVSRPYLSSSAHRFRGLSLTVSCEFAPGCLCVIDMYTCRKVYLHWTPLSGETSQPHENCLRTFARGNTALSLVSHWQRKEQTRKCTAW